MFWATIVVKSMMYKLNCSLTDSLICHALIPLSILLICLLLILNNYVSVCVCACAVTRCRRSLPLFSRCCSSLKMLWSNMMNLMLCLHNMSLTLELEVSNLH